jgi:hypothetical protein
VSCYHFVLKHYALLLPRLNTEPTSPGFYVLDLQVTGDTLDRQIFLEALIESNDGK